MQQRKIITATGNNITCIPTYTNSANAVKRFFFFCTSTLLIDSCLTFIQRAAYYWRWSFCPTNVTWSDKVRFWVSLWFSRVSSVLTSVGEFFSSNHLGNSHIHYKTYFLRYQCDYATLKAHALCIITYFYALWSWHSNFRILDEIWN